jgi:hypothetical protein
MHSHGLFIDVFSPLEIMLQPISWEFNHECYVGEVSKENNCGLFTRLGILLEMLRMIINNLGHLTSNLTEVPGKLPKVVTFLIYI